MYNNIKELATKIVGDGKSPNKWFVTVAYGWYVPLPKDEGEEPEMIQADNALESTTLLFTRKQDAMDFFHAVKIREDLTEVKGNDISQVIVEDRKNGTVCEKHLHQSHKMRFLTVSQF